VNTVVFDLAGTLLPSPTKRVLVETARHFEILIEVSPLRHVTIEEIAKEVETQGIEHKEFFETFWKNYSQYVTFFSLFPETRDVLEKLKEKGIRLALFSDVPKKIVRKILRDHELEHFFEVVITLDDVQKPKPSPEGLNLILRKLSVSKEDVIFVGDRIADKIAGERAGVKVLLLNQSSDLLTLLSL